MTDNVMAGGAPAFRSGIFTKNRFVDDNGVMHNLDGPLAPRDVTDGLSCTLMVGEKRLSAWLVGTPQFGDRFGYTSGFGVTTLRSGTARPQQDDSRVNATVGDGFGSAHPYGMNALFADGSVRTIRYDLSPDVIVLPWHIPPMGEVGINPLPSPPHPPSSLAVTLFMRLCHRADGQVADITHLD